MLSQLSILIPIYNGDPTALVGDLLAQISTAEKLDCEIIIGDDGSDAATQALLRALSGERVRVVRNEENRGRAAIRNRLAREARFDTLLFIDGGRMRVDRADFLQRYLDRAPSDIILSGGYSLAPGEGLRYRYERGTRQRNFHSCNFLIAKRIITAVPFDESFVDYGYEDVLLGVDLQRAGYTLLTIDNPTRLATYDTSATFLAKTASAMRTLAKHQDRLRGHVRLLDTALCLKRLGLLRPLAFIDRHYGATLQRQLCGARPSLLAYMLFKLCRLSREMFF